MTYNKTTWKTGDVITQEKLNHIEDGIGANLDTNISNISNLGKSIISGLGMPSNRYIDLTLGESGSTYTAPANGYFYLSKAATSGGQFATFENSSDGASGESCAITAYAGNYRCVLLRPVKKGTSIQLRYDIAGATQYFRFIYAEGDQ